MLASSSPERFVGRYVLLRLYVPRDSPLALCSLTFNREKLKILLVSTLHFQNVPTNYLIYFAFLPVSYAVFKVLAGETSSRLSRFTQLDKVLNCLFPSSLFSWWR